MTRSLRSSLSRGPSISRRAAFTLIELLVVIAIIALLIGILLPSLADAKRQGRYTKCTGLLQQFGVAINAYSITYQDKIVSFSWTTKTYAYTPYTDLQPAYGNDLIATASQAMDIIRRRAGGLSATDMPRPANWIPQILYNHLALVEDQDWPILGGPHTVCPEDRHRLRWTKSWQNFVSGAAAPTPSHPNNAPTGANRRWIGSASYNFVPAAMAPDSGPGAIWNAGSHRLYNPIVDPYTNVVGKRKYVDVINPSAKVVVHDSQARHYGKRDWHAGAPEAQQPLLFFDGHAKPYKNGVPELTGVTLAYGAQRRGNSINPGWVPTSPNSAVLPTYSYANPEEWEAPLRNGTRVGTETATGYFRYTRGGLKGIDIGAGEVNAR